MTGSDGYELSDRWQEAQLLMGAWCASSGRGSIAKEQAAPAEPAA